MIQGQKKRLAQDLLGRFSVEAAVQDPCVWVSVQGVYRRSPQKIFVRDLKVRSLFQLLKKISEQDLCSLHQVSVEDFYKRSPGKISVHDVYKSSVGKISVRGLLTRPLNKISIRGLLARSLYKLPIRGLLARFLHKHSTCTRACHKNHLRELTGTKPRQVSRTFCASLRSRNSYGHVTRAILRRSL